MIRIRNSAEDPTQFEVIDLETGTAIPMIRRISFDHSAWGEIPSITMEVLAEIDLVVEGKVIRQRWNTETNEYVAIEPEGKPNDQGN